jgi:excisionase family DNA binding protein
MMCTNPLLIGPEEAACLLSVPTRTVLSLIRRGDLPALRLPGRRLRIRAADLQEFVRRRPEPEGIEP